MLKVKPFQETLHKGMCGPASLKIALDYFGVVKTEKELAALVREKQISLQKFRFGISGSKVKNVKEGKNLRKDIARLMTEINKQAPKTTIA